MQLTPERYVALVKAGARPRCRRNGCERLCGVKKAVTARFTEEVGVVGVATMRISCMDDNRRRKRGDLEKLYVRRVPIAGYEGCPDNG